MKTWKKGLFGLLAALVILWLVVMVRGGTIIREAINTAGPKVLGVPVSVEDVSFLPLRGLVELKNLHVGNPEGYKTAGIFDLGLVRVKIKTASLFSRTIVIEAVKIEKPVITYERGLGNSNIGALLAKLEGSGEREAGSEEKPKGGSSKSKAPAGGGKKVIIRDLLVNGAQVKLSLTALQGLAAPIPLPPVHLTGIGEESGGTSFAEALGKIIGAILGAVTDVATGAGKLVGEGVGAVGGAAVDGVKAVGGAAGKLTEGIGNLIKGK